MHRRSAISLAGASALAAALAFLTFASAVAQTSPHSTTPDSSGTSDNTTRQGSPSPMGGRGMGMDADLVARHFISEMIPHHEDAVIMADLALGQAEPPELKELAARIKQVQTDEIALMRQWYRDWFGSEPAPGAAGEMAHGMGGHEARGIDGVVPFDRAFIEEMIPHHQMAVMMSSMALRAVDRPELRELLQSIIASQSAEIVQMRGWYQAWYGGAGAGGSERSTAELSSGHAGMGNAGRHGGMHHGQGVGFAPGAAIRGLGANEVEEIRAGTGAGLARAAELNGLPGPRHVLDLAGMLGLTSEQRAQIEGLHTAMRADALRVGPQYLAAQQVLEEGLRARSLDEVSLAAQHREVAGRRGELKLIHLRAHLATAALLTPSQIALYNTLRGYGAGS